MCVILSWYFKSLSRKTLAIHSTNNMYKYVYPHSHEHSELIFKIFLSSPSIFPCIYQPFGISVSYIFKSFAPPHLPIPPIPEIFKFYLSCSSKYSFLLDCLRTLLSILFFITHIFLLRSKLAIFLTSFWASCLIQEGLSHPKVKTIIY